MKRSKKSSVATIITMIIIGCVIVGAFAFFSNRDTVDSEKGEPVMVQTEVQKLLDKDIKGEYPATAREVVKLYSRFLKCIYSEIYNEEEFSLLADKVLLFYSEELLAVNALEDYRNQLQADVLEYRELDRTIKSYTVDSGDNIVNWTEDGIENARLFATYSIYENNTYTHTSEEFLLRKNEKGQWMIVGWRLADKEDTQ